jgi:hypothetical protein
MKPTKIMILFLLLVFIVGCQSAPKLSPEELRAKWRGPIALTAFNAAICTGISETAQKTQAGEIDGFSAFGELMGSAIMLRAVEESLVETALAEDTTEFYEQVQTDVETLKAVVGPWINDEITSAEVVVRLGDTCSDMNRTFEKVVEAASDEGLSRDAMDELMDELSQSLESVEP